MTIICYTPIYKNKKKLIFYQEIISMIAIFSETRIDYTGYFLI